MASSKLITFYISQVVIPIRNQMNRDAINAGLEEDFTKEMVDLILKNGADIDKSKIEMSNEELINVCRQGFKIGDSIGLSLDFPKGELDDMLDFKDLK